MKQRRAEHGGPRLAALLAATAALAVCGCSFSLPRSGSPANRVVVERDLVYVQRGDEALHADVYRPSGEGPFPGVLVVHGGSWQRGDKRRMSGTASRLAERGYVAVSIDYRLAPAYRFPAPLNDCEEAVRWMRANAARLHVDPTRIGGYGYSAGAHLVGLLATTSAADGLDEVSGAPDGEARLKAAVLGAAPVDLQQFIPNPAMIRLLGAWPGDRPDVYAMASPLNFVSADDPPIFLYHGTSDWMVDVSQSRLMRDALERVGVPAGYLEVPGGHFSTFLFDDGQVGRAIDFLDRWLAHGPSPAEEAAVAADTEGTTEQRPEGACPAE